MISLTNNNSKCFIRKIIYEEHISGYKWVLVNLTHSKRYDTESLYLSIICFTTKIGKCKLGYEEQNEWFFFSHKDRKYPTGTRTNRATTAGFWKATGRDKAVLSKDRIIGMRKTLVFYNGRAPNGRKSDWIMHEYRLQSSHHAPPQASSNL